MFISVWRLSNINWKRVNFQRSRRGQKQVLESTEASPLEGCAELEPPTCSQNPGRRAVAQWLCQLEEALRNQDLTSLASGECPGGHRHWKQSEDCTVAAQGCLHSAGGLEGPAEASSVPRRRVLTQW
jgi:hypothetical protein